MLVFHDLCVEVFSWIHTCETVNDMITGFSAKENRAELLSNLSIIHSATVHISGYSGSAFP